MPYPNAIVGLVVRTDPPIEKPCEEFLGKRPEGVTIYFEGDRQARLSPRDKAAGLLEIIEGARTAGVPLFVEVDPRTQEVERLRIPLRMRVVSIEDRDKQDIEVKLAISAARHVLKRDNPDFDELLAALREAQTRQIALLVTETDSHEIIDVRAYPPAGQRGPAAPALPEIRKHWLCRLFPWLCLVIRWLRCISVHRAREMFDLVAARNCDPLAIAPPCIPFMYPDDGCWARAHEMCRLMLEAGAKPRKVWLYYLWGEVITDNHLSCEVSWWYHVAPSLCVRERFFFTKEYIIDPSLFDEPVPRGDWVNRIGGYPESVMYISNPEIYFRDVDGDPIETDPTYEKTNEILAMFRLALQNRVLELGPPPYC